MKKPLLIAEVASAHEGKVEFAKQLCNVAAEAGADAIKFQVFECDQLLVPQHPKFASFGEIEMSHDEWRSVFESALSLSLDLWIEVFDESSLEFTESFERISGYKIPTSEINNSRFRNLVASTGKPIHLGIGGASAKEVKTALIDLKAVCAQSSVTVIHGFQSYPTQLLDTNLCWLGLLRDELACDIGFADHVDAELGLWPIVMPALATVLGASVIEKHITLDRSIRGRDYFSSLEGAELKVLREMLELLPSVWGSGSLSLAASAKDYGYAMQRFVVANKSLCKGQELTEDDIAFKRCEHPGLTPDQASIVVGRTLSVDVGTNEILGEHHFVS